MLRRSSTRITRNCVGYIPGVPFTFLMIGRRGGGGGASDFFGSEILAKSAFLGSMNNAGIFFGSPKK